ncbi:MAG: HD domain-containing phosphohydrolase [Bacillota bacterium]
MYRKSYRMRLMGIFLICTLTPILFMGIAGNYGLDKYIVSRHNESVIRQIDNESRITNKWFQDRINILNNIGNSIQLLEGHPLDLTEMNQYLAGQKANLPDFFNIYFTLEDGLSPAALESKPGIDFRQRPWYVAAKKKGDTVITPPYDDIITGTKVITISMPLKDSKGNFIGVIGADLDFDSVVGIIDKSKLSENSMHLVYDEEGNKILCHGEIFSDEEMENHDADLGLLSQHKGSYVKINFGNRWMMATYAELPAAGWRVVVLSDLQDFFAYANRIKTYFIGMSLAAVLIMIIAAIVASKKIAKPLVVLRDQVKSFGVQGTDKRIIHDYHDELGEVMDAFNQMAATIKDNYENLRAQTKALIESNDQLQEMNIEVEASYEQLQATMEQLNDSEQKYRLLIENMTDLVWVIDEKGIVTYMNNQIEHILGYTVKEVVGMPMEMLLCPLHQYEDCKNVDGLLEAFQQIEFDKKHLWMLSKDGQTRLIIETSTKLLKQDDKHTGVQGIGRNVTEVVKKNKTIAALYEVTNSLTSTTDTLRLNHLLQTVVDKIVDVMNVSICTIRLLRGDMLEFRATSGKQGHLVSRDPIALGEDMMGRAVQEQKIIYIRNFDEAHLTSHNKMILNKCNFKQAIYIPLVHEEEVLGVVTIASMALLDDNDLQTLSALANYAAIAMEKSKLYEDLRDAYLKTIRALAVAVEAKDTYTQGHSIRVSQYAVLIARQLNMTNTEIEEIEIAGILHDIGKIGISDTILTKPGKLSEHEFGIITQHPKIGSKILEPIGVSPKIHDAVLLHHKRYDLTGYPHEISLDELPVFAQIIGVADAFDAMISNRSYKDPMTMEEAVEELRRCSGGQFSPCIVEAMEILYREHAKEIKKIASR